VNRRITKEPLEKASIEVSAEKLQKVLRCPFTIITDSREQTPYTFKTLRGSAAQKHAPIIVETVRHGLQVGDYSIFGMPGVVVERKSKEDLYGSVVKRTNFEGRLARMAELSHSAVVVEADYLDLMSQPPRYSKLHPRSLSRTLIAWSIRYPVRWWFVGGRDAGEAITFRVLERFWLDNRDLGVASGSRAVSDDLSMTEDEMSQGETIQTEEND
jgi:ERCC4-type nuclease